jgi:hypothetical protein
MDTMVAMVHLMLHNVGFKNSNKEVPMTEKSVTMGKGMDIGAKMIVQLPGVVCNKNSPELQEAVLGNNLPFQLVQSF